MKQTGLPLPKRIIADAGYGGEANYLYAHKVVYEVLILYNTMRKEKTCSYQKNIRHVRIGDVKKKISCTSARITVRLSLNNTQGKQIGMDK